MRRRSVGPVVAALCLTGHKLSVRGTASGDRVNYIVERKMYLGVMDSRKLVASIVEYLIMAPVNLWRRRSIALRTSCGR